MKLRGKSQIEWSLDQNDLVTDEACALPLTKLMPNAPFIDATNPEYCAQAVLDATKDNVDEKLLKEVAAEFCVGIGQRCLFLAPEHLHQNELKKAPMFCYSLNINTKTSYF